MKNYIYINNTPYEFEFERKRIRNINLRIRQDGSIHVSAPMRVSNKAVEEFLKSKASFIVHAVESVNSKKARNIRPEMIENGTVVKVFGEDRTVALLLGKRNSVIMIDDTVFITVKDIDDRELVTKVYNKWRSELLRQKVTELCEQATPVFVQMGAKAPTKIKFRTMKSRWGSCKPSEGVITFNYNLFEVPEECVWYVVVHEYAHLLVPNHSDKFYRYVGIVCPRWREIRRILNEY